MIESDVRISGIEPNWTHLLGGATAAINNKNAETAYKAVFGHEYHQHIKCSVLEAYENAMIGALIFVTNDSKPEGKANDLFFFVKEGLGMDDIQDGEHDGFWNNCEDDS
jgi:hypothetical protein